MVATALIEIYFAICQTLTIQDICTPKDVDKDGEVEYTEFIAATLEARGNLEEERIAEAFDRLDTDQSGFISKRELAQFLGTTATSKEVDEILQEADTNNDGQCKSISFVAHIASYSVTLLSERLTIWVSLQCHILSS